jgi:hypothetical protein
MLSPESLVRHHSEDVLPELPLTGTCDDESVTVRLTGTGPEKAFPPVLPLLSASNVHSSASTATFTWGAEQFESVVTMPETSLKPTKKGSLAGYAKEPFQIAPLGFEPRLIESESIVLPLH